MRHRKILAALWLAAFAMACSDSPQPPRESNPQYSYVRDYGNGVFYFPYAKDEFGREFSAWRAVHKGWIIIAIAPDDTEAYGYTRGYFVIANPDM